MLTEIIGNLRISMQTKQNIIELQKIKTKTKISFGIV